MLQFVSKWSACTSSWTARSSEFSRRDLEALHHLSNFKYTRQLFRVAHFAGTSSWRVRELQLPPSSTIRSLLSTYRNSSEQVRLVYSGCIVAAASVSSVDSPMWSIPASNSANTHTSRLSRSWPGKTPSLGRAISMMWSCLPEVIWTQLLYCREI